MKKSFYDKYTQFTTTNNSKPVARTIFHRLRKKSHVNIFSGDQYSDPRWIALQKYTKLREEILNKPPTTDKDKENPRVLDELITPLLGHNDAANYIHDKFQEDIESLKTNLEKRVVVIDFTKWNQVTSGNVHSLVVVVCRGERQDGGVVKVCWKNYDCLAQKTENLPVKQTFSYVKTAFLKLWSDEVF